MVCAVASGGEVQEVNNEQMVSECVCRGDRIVIILAFHFPGVGILSTVVVEVRLMGGSRARRNFEFYNEKLICCQRCCAVLFAVLFCFVL